MQRQALPLYALSNCHIAVAMELYQNKICRDMLEAVVENYEDQQPCLSLLLENKSYRSSAQSVVPLIILSILCNISSPYMQFLMSRL